MTLSISRVYRDKIENVFYFFSPTEIIIIRATRWLSQIQSRVSLFFFYPWKTQCTCSILPRSSTDFWFLSNNNVERSQGNREIHFCFCSFPLYLPNVIHRHILKIFFFFFFSNFVCLFWFWFFFTLNWPTISAQTFNRRRRSQKGDFFFDRQCRQSLGAELKSIFLSLSPPFPLLL